MILIGELSLWLALIVAAWATIVSFAGGALHRPDLARSGARALYATFGFIVLASVGLWDALVTHDFNIARYAKRVVQFFDGRMVSDEPVKEQHSAHEEWQAMQEDQARAQGKVMVREVPVS